MIRVEGVSHWFGSFQVLRDVWFRVPEGEVFGFIGPNGAGKTTTIRMIATLLRPHVGRVLIDGIDVAEYPERVRQLIGFMPDDFGVYERMTVSEYLEFFAAAHKLPRNSRKTTIDAVMELTELGGLRDRMVSAMSKGMKQRLAIARTLLHDPKVLILDEPANGLDPRARIEMRELIEELQGLGKTILLSSHILTELADMVTSVAILERGALLTAGPLGEITRKLQPERGLMLKALCAPTKLIPIVTQVGGVLSAEEVGDELRVRFEGEEEIIAEIVRACVSAGAPIIGVEAQRNDLERIFLEVTKGELQ